VTRDGMFQAIQEFGGKLRDGDVALFYFAGHAIQVRDRNYLIPVDAKVKQEDDVTFYSLDVAEVLQRMDRARTRANLLILDACRDNPFASTCALFVGRPGADERAARHADRVRDRARPGGARRHWSQRRLHQTPAAPHDHGQSARRTYAEKGARGGARRHQGPAGALGFVQPARRHRVCRRDAPSPASPWRPSARRASTPA
jgi:hypothetical protein